MMTTVSLTIALFAMLAALIPTHPAHAGPGMIRVRVQGLQNNDGEVGCVLFSSSEGWPSEGNKAVSAQNKAIKNKFGECVFTGIKPGTYAVAVRHDANGNNELDANALGIPTEGWGVSNNADPGPTSPPTFDAASFEFNGAVKVINVALRY